MLLVANLGEADIKQAAAWLERSGLRGLREPAGLAACAVAAPIEAEMAELTPEDAQTFRDDLGLAEPGLDRVIRSTYELLGLVSFLTAGEDECRGVDDRRGTRAQVAAGTIHSDIERGFIRAQVVTFSDLVAAGSLAACREKGTLRLEGRDYLVQDGDVIEFKFNVSRPTDGELPPPAVGAWRWPARQCLYCGAPLASAAAAARAQPAPAAAETPRPRAGAGAARPRGRPSPRRSPRRSRVSHYEATLLARRGGLHLVRAAEPEAAAAEAERLRARGAQPWLVPEAEVRTPPLAVPRRRTAGRRAAAAHHRGPRDARAGRRAAGRARVDHARVPAAGERRRIATARLDGGLPGAHPPPRASCARWRSTRSTSSSASPSTGSVRLEIDAWLEAVGRRRPARRRLQAPAAGAGTPRTEPGGALAAAGTLAASAHGGTGESRSVVLDNLAQFRFYSGCLAAVRRAPRGRRGSGVACSRRRRAAC